MLINVCAWCGVCVCARCEGLTTWPRLWPNFRLRTIWQIAIRRICLFNILCTFVFGSFNNGFLCICMWPMVRRTIFGDDNIHRCSDEVFHGVPFRGLSKHISRQIILCRDIEYPRRSNVNMCCLNTLKPDMRSQTLSGNDLIMLITGFYVRMILSIVPYIYCKTSE